MRLIDADKLEDVVTRANEQGFDVTRYEFKRIELVIFEFPTIDAEPVRHAHWIDVNGDGSLWRCSECGETQCCESNYCGDCGAKMDEVTE